MFVARVVEQVAEIERSLRALGGVGRGLGDLSASLSDDLPVTLREGLRRVGSVRNRVIHQNAQLTQHQMDAYLGEVEEVRTLLEELVGALPSAVALARVETTLPEQQTRAALAVPEAAAFSPPPRAAPLPAVPLPELRRTSPGGSVLWAAAPLSAAVWGTLQGGQWTAHLYAALCVVAWTLLRPALPAWVYAAGLALCTAVQVWWLRG